MDSKRINVSQKGNDTVIEITPIRNELKSKLLLTWLIVWTICGIVVFSQFFSNMSREEKLLMAIWMAFWAYFELKISTVYAWRKNGFEKIRINDESLIYVQVNSQKAPEKEYLLDNISGLEVYEFGKNSFSDSFQTSYWVKGNESIFFTCLGAKTGLGLQLNKEEANQVYQAINKKLKKRK